MKQILTLLSLIIILSILSYPENINGNTSGSPGAKTNSPIDGNNCTVCHTGTINSGPGEVIISSNIPTTGYIPGQVYTITASVTESGKNKFGFEMTSEDGTNMNNKLGQWIITNQNTTKKINNDNAVTHKAMGTSSSNNISWSADWQAPGFGMSTGIVKFYAAAVAANGNNNNQGDNVYTTEYIINEQQPSSIDEHKNIIDILYSNNKLSIISNKNLNQLIIYTIHGKLISKYQDNNIPKEIDMKDFLKGIYIVNIIDKDLNTYSKKINIL